MPHKVSEDSNGRLTGLLGGNLSCLARAALGGELLLKPSTRAFCHFQLLMRLFHLVPCSVACDPLCGNLKADLRELLA